MPGTLFVVATPIGNLDDISNRALKILREVAVIAAEDTRRTAHLLARYAITTSTTSLHEHNEASKSTALVARLLRGDDLALVSDAGTPTVSDPGATLIAAAIAAGIRIVPIPGPSAALAALAASGFPSDTFLFLGFPPTRAKDRAEWFDEVRTAQRTVVFYEAPHRITQTLEHLRDVLGECRILVARELTKLHEQLVNGPISDVLARLETTKGEFTVVVNIGQMPDYRRDVVASDSDIFAEFGVLTNSKGLDRKRAISMIAEKHGQPRNEVYAAIERAKKLVT